MSEKGEKLFHKVNKGRFLAYAGLTKHGPIQLVFTGHLLNRPGTTSSGNQDTHVVPDMYEVTTQQSRVFGMRGEAGQTPSPCVPVELYQLLRC